LVKLSGICLNCAAILVRGISNDNISQQN